MSIITQTLLLLLHGQASPLPQEIVGVPIKNEHSRELVATARALLEGNRSTLKPDDGPTGLRLVLVSLARPDGSAMVGQGHAPSLRGALTAAVKDLQKRCGPGPYPGVVKVDVATRVDAPQNLANNGLNTLKQGLRGLNLVNQKLVLLPEELHSRSMIDRGNLVFNRLSNYLNAGVRTEIPDLKPLRQGSRYQLISFVSFVEAPNRPLRLYRGSPALQKVTPANLLAAARAGGDYLVRHQEPSGKFNYSYDPTHDRSLDGYNLLRHAGACYALFELHVETAEKKYLRAGNNGLAYLSGFYHQPNPQDATANFLALRSPGDQAKLGGAALAMLALLQQRSITGSASNDSLLKKLATFLEFQQEPNGHFKSKYFFDGKKGKPFESIYYPGEAILAASRLYRVTADERHLKIATSGARWLISVRDKGKDIHALPHDHWLLMGLLELHQLTGDAMWSVHAQKIANAILQAQKKSRAYPDQAGTFYNPPRVTPTATRAEALVAAWHLARANGRNGQAISEALSLMAAFQMRCQINRYTAMYLPNPTSAMGGFRRGLHHWEVRIDYVQHNVSALLGLRKIMLIKAQD